MFPAEADSGPSKSNKNSSSDAPISASPINKTNTDESYEKPRDREARRSEPHRRRFPRAEIWLALFTGILVIETAFTYGVLSSTDHALHDTAKAEQGIRQVTEATERAWIAPLDPWMIRIPNIGSAANVIIRAGNVGRSPALDMRLSTRFDTIVAPPNLNFEKTDTVTGNFCKDDPPIEDVGVTYPNTGEAHYEKASLPILWNPDLQTGSRLMRVRICISYQTFAKAHQVWSCFAFLPDGIQQHPPATAPAPARPSITGYVGVDCIGGHGAD